MVIVQVQSYFLHGRLTRLPVNRIWKINLVYKHRHTSLHITRIDETLKTIKAAIKKKKKIGLKPPEKKSKIRRTNVTKAQ